MEIKWSDRGEKSHNFFCEAAIIVADAAALLVFGRAVLKGEVTVNRALRLVFQDAEENIGTPPDPESGAEKLIASGVLEGVAQIAKWHVNPFGRPGFAVSPGTPAPVNDEEFAKDAAAKLAAAGLQVYPMPGLLAGEDFGFYARRAPSLFFGIAGENPTPPAPPHSAKFNPDPKVLKYGIAADATAPPNPWPASITLILTMLTL